MHRQTAPVPAPGSKRQAVGELLTFPLAERLWGVELNAINEVVSMPPRGFTPTPGGGDCLLGLVNLGGRVIPVLSALAALTWEDGNRTAPPGPNYWREAKLLLTGYEQSSVGLAVPELGAVYELSAGGEPEPESSQGLALMRLKFGDKQVFAFDLDGLIRLCLERNRR